MFRCLFIFVIIGVSLKASGQKGRDNFSTSISQSLKQFLTSHGTFDSVDLVVTLTDSFSGLPNSTRIISKYDKAHTAIVRVKTRDAREFLKNKKIAFADLNLVPTEELTTGTLDLAANKANLAHNRYPGITGNGIVASIKENLFDTTDIDFKGRYIATKPSPTTTTHASIMATTLAGAGNTSPFAKGVAFGANISSSNFANLLPDEDSVFINNNISVQNHSYGTEIQNYYGAEAFAYDISAVSNRSLIHVFSSGNSGTGTAASGNYAGLSGVANLTGNYKLAKNVITAGAVDSFYNISPLSSKGPAYDGRVKPELVAFGEGGSSGAAAMVSGAVALVQQAYKMAHRDSLPASSTVKAVLLNTADDVGPRHVDFLSGYGNLNAFKALQTITTNQIIEGVIRSSEVKRFPVTIPANTAELKLTLVWTDAPAVVSSTKALINNVDVVLQSTSGQQWLPWVLNSKSHPDSLFLAAIRQQDTLNNVEQISVENPEPGAYTIEVRGTQITGSQSFSIAYQYDTTDQFYFSFPTSNDRIIAGRTNVIRWETNYNRNATLEYSTNGTNWSTIANLPAVLGKYYQWNTPDTFTIARLRMKFAGRVDAFSDTFTVSKSPATENGFNCIDSFLFYWNKLPVTNYRLYNLGENYLTPFATTTDTFALLNKSAYLSGFYSIAPLIQGKEGLKSFILNTNNASCYFKSFYLQALQQNSASLTALLGSLYGVNTLSFQKKHNNRFTSISNIDAPSSTSFLFIDPSLTQGENIYRLQLNLRNGRVLYSNDVRVYYFNEKRSIFYPNPVHRGQPLNIITSLAGKISIRIYNVEGKLTQQLKPNSLYQQIQTGHLAKGVYLIKIINEDGSYEVQKLVVY